MAKNDQKIGWIGMGRMGFPMAERLLKAGYDVSIWNRTRAKAEPLAAKGGKVVDKLVRSRRRRRAVFDRLDRQGPQGGLFRRGRRGHRPQRQAAEDLRRLLLDRGREVGEHPRAAQRLGADFVAAPISGNGKVIKAGKLSSVISGRGGGRQDRAADHRGDRAAGRLLCRRGRARAHLQDRAQRDARRRDREPGRDHAARQQDGRAAPRVPGVHEQQRDGLDVHRATSRRRWSISTGPRPSRRNCCARTSTSASSSAATRTCRCR